eukprot:10585852-Ditylum_brightwellii.AAC.1
MEYHMCTAKGVSEGKHHNLPDNPAYGSGQGACNAGTKWNYTENFVTRVYNKKAKGCTIRDPNNKIQHTQNAVTFVDNKTLLHNCMSFDTSP